MKPTLFICVLIFCCIQVQAQQKTVAQIKADIEKSTNGPLYVKDVLKKRFSIDTVPIMHIGNFAGLPDSLAYYGKVGKVYGPYDRGRVLVQILGKAPNTFNRISQIFLDTTVFSRRFSDSLATSIISRIQSGTATFEEMAQTYSMGGEGMIKGDLGWVAAGAMKPYIEREIVKRKKGEIFKVWSPTGLHIIRKTDTKQ